ncbi:decaprenyl-diphosphate synthase subunit 1 [Plakobranchus ocellatus]|uniref:Decaprenyl-diphosphate synthase subunit 1 n=1 Tax=Plakobranchus ocellatus TaxID=259542 RepID=A0AAV3YYI2_9GAST|nr:decaprenyl-diphosphate synthase subunit 1 [Plakobranchus ocellatus]
MATSMSSCRSLANTVKAFRNKINILQENIPNSKFTFKNSHCAIDLPSDGQIRRLHSCLHTLPHRHHHHHFRHGSRHLRHHIPSGRGSASKLCCPKPQNFQCHQFFPRIPFSSSSNPSDLKEGSQSEIDPYKLVLPELTFLMPNICKKLNVDIPQMQHMAQMYFGKGKAYRPMVAMLMAKACNVHCRMGDSVLESQKIVAMVSEMVHTSSLVHDDVVDGADTRRGMPSVNKTFGQRKAILTGDYILSQATIALARTGNPHVISLLATVIEDLICGEFMQLGSKEDENERFQHYLKKTYKKTASLIANTCKSVATLCDNEDEDVVDVAFEYGRNLGMAFQLVDDMLDFVSSQQTLGKPAAADLKLGLATAPVLFAAIEHRELQPMIMRRFSEEGDVEYARAMVEKSDGIGQTRMLASQHSTEAVKKISQLSPSPARDALITVAKASLERKT